MNRSTFFTALLMMILPAGAVDRSSGEIVEIPIRSIVEVEQLFTTNDPEALDRFAAAMSEAARRVREAE